ncbi:hypothetical protein MPH_01705 [Macrophomina phaseolina MS6]|uniref:Uncharacterized protein n=1 Tax=Macrophomina phaseolina (strain MS6) TaxID=1126212 RepID=K2SWQ2_MACPH|nr:hypothetical protein MPH_01705 [Macrophomina phaseolina MS6]
MSKVGDQAKSMRGCNVPKGLVFLNVNPKFEWRYNCSPTHKSCALQMTAEQYALRQRNGVASSRPGAYRVEAVLRTRMFSGLPDMDVRTAASTAHIAIQLLQGSGVHQCLVGSADIKLRSEAKLQPAQKNRRADTIDLCGINKGNSSPKSVIRP